MQVSHSTAATVDPMHIHTAHVRAAPWPVSRLVSEATFDPPVALHVAAVFR